MMCSVDPLVIEDRLFANNNDFYYFFIKQDTAVGNFVVTHGHGEHSSYYRPLATLLAKQGWNVFAWDLRGHGRSGGGPGGANDFHQYVADLIVFLQVVASKGCCELPTVLFGHSMGSLIQIKSVLTMQDQGPCRIVAQALSAPLLGFGKVPPKWKAWASNIVAPVFPDWKPTAGIEFTQLSRDPAMLQIYQNDSLRHDLMALRVFASIRQTLQTLFQGSCNITLPTLFQLAGDDEIVNNEKSRAFFDSIPVEGKRLVTYSNSKHEIFNDVDRDTASSDLLAFLSIYQGSKA